MINTVVVEKVEEIPVNKPLLGRKRKLNPEPTKSAKPIAVNLLKVYKQEEVSFYNIIDLLELFMQYTGINYENTQLKVNNLSKFYMLVNH